MITLANEFAGAWWGWMWPMFWQVSLLIVIGGALDAAMRKWAWPQVFYALWLLVLLKLVLPPTLASPVSIVGAFGTLGAGHEAVATGFEYPVPLSAPTVALPNAPDPGAGLSWMAWLMLVWAVGVLFFGAWVAVKVRTVRRMYRVDREHAPVPAWMDELLASAAARLKLRRIPALVASPHVSTPAVFGVARPVLILPARDLSTLSKRDAEHILMHELAHIKRGDLIVHALALVVQIVYWFNPLVWVAQRRMRGLRELCCDATVAGVLRDETPVYRRTLLETARCLLERPREFALGFLGLMEDTSMIVTRLKWLEKRAWRNRRLRVATVSAVVAVMVGCVLPMTKPSPTGKSAERPTIVIRADDTLRGPPPQRPELTPPHPPEQPPGEPDSWSPEERAAFVKAFRAYRDSVRMLQRLAESYRDSVATYRAGVHEVRVPEDTSRVLRRVSANEPYEFWMVEEKPTLLTEVTPVYPESARRDSVEGYVFLEMVVGRDGKVESVTVLRGAPVLADAAREAAMKMVFTPGKLRGKPVRVKVVQRMAFRLNEAQEPQRPAPRTE